MKMSKLQQKIRVAAIEACLNAGVVRTNTMKMIVADACNAISPMSIAAVKAKATRVRKADHIRMNAVLW